MSRKKLTEDEYNDIKRMSGSTRAIARIAHRSEETIRFIWDSKDFSEFQKLRYEYSTRYRTKEESAVGDELYTGATTSGRRITIFEAKENMVKLYTKPIPRSKAEAIQKALKDAGLDIFEDYYY